MKSFLARHKWTIAATAVLFGVAFAAFAWRLDGSLRLRREFSTGLIDIDGGQIATTHRLYYLSSDGRKLMTETIEWGFAGSRSHKTWDVTAGRELALSVDEDWQNLEASVGPAFYDRPRESWEPFLNRLREGRRVRDSKRPNLKEPGPLFPEYCGFSSCGRFFAYPTMDLPPDGEGYESPGCDVIVEETSSGREVGRIRNTFMPPQIAPGGPIAARFRNRTADHLPSILSCWQVDTGEVLFEKAMPNCRDGHVLFSPYGKTVFLADEAFGENNEPRIYWWDAAGNQIGVVNSTSGFTLIDSGTTLVACVGEYRARQEKLTVGARFEFWNVPTARKIYEWPIPLGKPAWVVGAFSPSDDGRFFAALIGRESDNEARLNYEVILFDSRALKPITTLPGSSAVFSANDRWLATMDVDGVVRVYQLPLGRPWWRIIGYSAAVALAGGALLALGRRMWRRRWKSASVGT